MTVVSAVHAQTAPPITVPDRRDVLGSAGNTGGSISAGVTGVDKAGGVDLRGRSPAPLTQKQPAEQIVELPTDNGCRAPMGEGGDGGPCEFDAHRPTPPPPQTIARSILDRTDLPLPGIRTSPPPNKDQLVNLETWMWVENWSRQSASATVAGLSVTVVATPRSVVWRMGTGEPVRCRAGTPWNPALREEEQSSDCTFTYGESSANQPDLMYKASATMTWAVTWTASNGESGSLGLASTTTPFRMRVAEGQAVVTG